MRLQEQLSLAACTTLGIGGPARWFATAQTEDDVVEACGFARERALPLSVLGGGSNLLIADAGFPGLVLHIRIPGITDAGHGRLAVGAGEIWESLVNYTVHHHLAGMECLAGIPGTVGGTPVQNVGAYGQEVSETIEIVRAWDTLSSRFVDLSNADCGFNYRTSIFNTAARGRYIITRVSFALREGGAPLLQYADLQRAFPEGSTPSLIEVAAAVRAIRGSKSMVIHPEDENRRSAGSFFRNPVVPSAQLALIAAAAATRPEQVPHWPAGRDTVKLPAAWLLEHAGFTRGYTLGNAGISTRHTLALINRGGATAAEIMALRDCIIATVQERFGIRLEQEPVNLP